MKSPEFKPCELVKHSSSMPKSDGYWIVIDSPILTADGSLRYPAARAIIASEDIPTTIETDWLDANCMNRSSLLRQCIDNAMDYTPSRIVK